MDPVHHVHISTGFLFVIMMFALGTLAVILAFVQSARRDRLRAERRSMDLGDVITNVRPTPTPFSQSIREGRWAPSTGYAPVSHGHSPVYAAAPVYAHDPMMGLATGMLLGEALSHHDHTTVVHDSSPSYSDSSSSYSSSSSDSGFSYSDSSSSYDSGSSSGGFDASW
jgi:hypothetical protein